MMNKHELAGILEHIALEVRTIYALGGYGAALREDNVERWCAMSSENRKTKIRQYVNTVPATYCFDCVGLIKSIRDGWNESPEKNYGGAIYKGSDLDYTIPEILHLCSDVSDDFTNIDIGEFLYYDSGVHCGIYIGDGKAVECTPIWSDGVQITKVSNITHTNGYQSRKWAYHGKLPWIDYSEPSETPSDTVDSGESDSDGVIILEDEKTAPEGEKIDYRGFFKTLMQIIKKIIKWFKGRKRNE